MNSIDKLTGPLSAAGFDPTQIVAIVEGVLNLLGACPNKDAAAAGTIPKTVETALLSGAVRRALRAHGKASDPVTVRKAVAVIQQARDAASDDDRDDLRSGIAEIVH